ncbi:N-acetylmuramoyl-L-alanine amidase family protein [Rossellomorea marisflavi]|uniref:N-acetylmuramoyl-L-alanine amidase family protein n=1 Tax=Rossellomorea marisflavi TaxID=189381 RepID=UPI00069E0F28|nr:N-acetylmuramoyl-L-alanine amidase [Rossellomorea marisflavi]
MAKASDFLIALDDGHGMETPGKRTPYIESLGRQIRENEFNAAVTNYLKIELERCGFRTVLTAPTDVDTPLKERTDLANSLNADALVSNHFNALKDRFDPGGNDPEGHSIHIYPGDAVGRQFAEKVAKYMRQNPRQKFRGIIEQNLHITREFKNAAILIENGFMDNRRESLLMIDQTFQQERAREEAQGICEYFGVPYVGGSAPAPAPAPSPTQKPVTGSEIGKRVESIYQGADQLNFYSKPTFNQAFVAGKLAFGYGFPKITAKINVEGAQMYEVQNSKGNTYYVTASPQFVKVVGAGTSTPQPPSSPSIKAIGEITIIGVANAAIVQDRPDRLASNNLGTINKGQTIRVAGSVKGKNSPSGYWEVIYNGKRAYITGELGQFRSY